MLILSSPEDKTAAERTASLLPKSIPVLHLRFAQVFQACYRPCCIRSILVGLQQRRTALIQVAEGSAIRPPTLPPSCDSQVTTPDIAIPDRETNAIERKSGLAIATLHARNQLGRVAKPLSNFPKDADGDILSRSDLRLRRHALRFRRTVHRTSKGSDFRSRVPTSGRHRHRNRHWPRQVRQEGASIAIRQRALRKLIVIGYHNAGEIGWLDDDTVPPDAPPLHQSLSSINAASPTGFVSQHARLEARDGRSPWKRGRPS